MKNTVLINGQVTKDFELDHEVYGEKFMRSTICIERESGVADELPIIISERLLDSTKYKGKFCKITGQLRSHSNREAERKLKVYIFVLDIKEEDGKYRNFVDLEEVYIVKPPVYRITPLGKEISDIMLVCNRRNAEYYIPAICWGRNARFVSNLEVGTKLQVQGRMQSREYLKNGILKTAYELSIDLVTSP